MTGTNGTAIGPPSIVVNDLTIERSGVRILTDVSFEFGPGTLVGVVGPNGAGKSTLFEAISGRIPIHHGTAEIRAERPLNEGAVAYVPQRDSINWENPRHGGGCRDDGPDELTRLATAIQSRGSCPVPKES